MVLKPYTEVVKPLVFPINGRTYETWGPGITDWQLVLAIEAGTATAEEAAGADLYRLVLGPLWDTFVADGVPHRTMQRAALSCAAYARTGSEQVAEAVWLFGTDQAAVAGWLEEQNAAPAASAPKPAPAARRKPVA